MVCVLLIKCSTLDCLHRVKLRGRTYYKDTTQSVAGESWTAYVSLTRAHTSEAARYRVCHLFHCAARDSITY